MKRKYSIFCFILLVFSFSCKTVNPSKTLTAQDIKIIPIPAVMEVGIGIFSFNKETKLVAKTLQEEIYLKPLRDKFLMAAGWDLETVSQVPKTNYLKFVVNNDLGEDIYELNIQDDAIVINAGTISGFTYAISSLLQLLPVEIEEEKIVQNVNWQVPVIFIKDEPRFQWRGLMLDVSRHFFKKDYILDVIDRMVFLKLNTFHLHLVDDQGWRIEIKKYPKLTEIGAFRVDHEDKHWNVRPVAEPGEEATLGGFYTQDEIKEIVAYATSKGITVVPEIEMPAHVMSAIAAYPELSCFENDIAVPSGGIWPITEIYCAGKEFTFTFLENVLSEVMDLFPSKYIHVGGDEATKTNWKTCPHCQQRMKEEGLEDVQELQSYFIKRMERFICSKGRILIGWDEILEGGLASGATVMSWRGTQGGWEASHQGHDVIMTPSSHMYFDYYQGDQDTEPLAFGGYVPLSKVYQFDPVVDSMSIEQEKRILGGQANLWSEYITTSAHSEYMMLPRLVALAEVLWSPKQKLDWADFSSRLRSNLLPRYDLQKINYARSSFGVTSESSINVDDNSLSVILNNEYPDPEIRYTINGQNPDAESTIFIDPLEFFKTTTIKAAVFENGVQIGETYEATLNFHKGVGKKVSYYPPYHDSYKGAEEMGMVNILRGSKNFHDGQWQGWLEEDVEVIIDMEEKLSISRIAVGTLESQGSGIYFPVKVEAFVSRDGENFMEVGCIQHQFKQNASPEIRDFSIDFQEEEARYVKVIVTNLGETAQGGSSWLFLDEIIIE